MHVDFIEALRCPQGHAESALVASATRQVERRIVDGMLGCPVCGAEFPIRQRVTDFRAGAPRDDGAGSEEHPDAATDDRAVRLAAQLDLSEPGRRVLLCGAYAQLAPALTVMFDAMCLTCGTGPGLEQHIAAHASVLRLDTVLPLAPATLHGVAVDAEHAARLGLDQVQAVLRPRGRLVAPAQTPTPPGTDVLAVDDREWVARRGPADVVPLKRAPR